MQRGKPMLSKKQINDILILVNNAEEKFKSGDYEDALVIINKIKSFGSDELVVYFTSGLLIDIGKYLSDEIIVKDAVRSLKQGISKLSRRKEFAPLAFYNLGNGYSALFSFKFQRNKYADLFKKTDLESAKKYYIKALQDDSLDSHIRSQISVNLGNCFDHLGRVFDALEWYEEAIRFKSDHGMAYGNKGLAFYYLAALDKKCRPIFLREAYSLINKALKLGVNRKSIPGFITKLNNIEKYLAKGFLRDKSYRKIEIKAKTIFEKSLIEFCLKNKLYLNICTFCQKCGHAIGDPAFIESMLISLKEDGGSNIGKSRFNKLASYINQIKQDYITARFLLILSKYRKMNLKFVDKNVRLVDTLDYSSHNIRIELLKASFTLFYNILDKIAYFLSNYLHIEETQKKLDFGNVWYNFDANKKIHEQILNTKNFSLNALFNMHKDFERGENKKLTNIRNTLTHGFLNIYSSLGIIKSGAMTEISFERDTIRLARYIRNAILYLLKFIFIEEQKKKKKLAYDIPDLPMLDLPDKYKDFE